MRTMSKFLSICLVLVLVVTVGCSGKVDLVAEEELVDKVVEVYQGIETVQFDMNMSMQAEMKIGAKTEQFDSTTTGSGVIDNVNQAMKMTMQMQMPGLDGAVAETMETEMYFINNVLYTKMGGIADMPVTWTKMAMPPDYEPMPIDQLVKLLKTSKIEVLGTEEIDGVYCYVVKLTPDIKQFWEMMTQQMGLGLDIPAKDIDATALEEMIESLSITQWIAQDTFLPLKEQTQMTLVMNPVNMDLPDVPPEESFESRIVMDITTTYHSYNEPVTIQLPAAAKDAQSMDEVMAEIGFEGTIKEIDTTKENTVLVVTEAGTQYWITIKTETDIMNPDGGSASFDALQTGQKVSIIFNPEYPILETDPVQAVASLVIML
ncbi:MAG: hypothetical protein LRZ99_05190 [Desulfotomaculum sp.]|nr:hypothetical protein [Desulfotomaculum sp.]